LERKRYLQIAAVVIVVLILGAGLYNYVYLPSLPKELTKFKLVMISPPQDANWEYTYANDTGIYREEGLEVEIAVVRTPPEAAQALLSGDVDATSSVDAVFGTFLGGAQQIRIVSAMARPIFALYVRPEVNSIQDVKSIAVPGRGSSADVLSREYLIQHGLKPDVDVSFQYLSQPTLLPALLSRQVDAIALGTGGYTPLNEGKAKMLFKFAEEYPKWIQSGLTVTEKTIAEKPQLVKAFVKALYRSQVALLQNKEKAIEYAVNHFKLDRDYATFVYEYAYQGGAYGAATKIIPDMPIGDLEYTMQMVAKYMSVPAPSIQGCIDTQFMDQVKKELG
jgi:ABC-type nitrate/sulfonate/bicarbonate transport system substrate-binding protein